MSPFGQVATAFAGVIVGVGKGAKTIGKGTGEIIGSILVGFGEVANTVGVELARSVKSIDDSNVTLDTTPPPAEPNKSIDQSGQTSDNG